jgi:hypothetical protein
MIHSANSRLLNCSRLLQKLNKSPSQSPPQPQSNDTQQLCVKIEPPDEPVFPETSSTSYPYHLTSPPLPESAPYTPQSDRSGSSVGTLPDFDIDLPDMLDDIDPSGFSIDDQDLTSIRAILEQTFKDGTDVFGIFSTVY